MARDEAYRKAEQKIENALHAQAKVLALWGDPHSKLTEIPETLAQLTHLQDLNISDNELTVLPDWIGNFTELQSLGSVPVTGEEINYRL